MSEYGDIINGLKKPGGLEGFEEFTVLDKTGLSYVVNINEILETASGETDPIFRASPAYSITNANISNWNAAYGWGNHALAGYLTSFTEVDPVFVASVAYNITSSDIINWNTAYSWGDHAGLYANIVHTHVEANITDLDKYTVAAIDSFFSGESLGKKQIEWVNVLNVPGTFPPQSHTHIENEITNLDKYNKAEIDAFFEGEDLGKKQVDWARIVNTPASFPPSAHTHVEVDITDLDKYTQSEVDSLIHWSRTSTTISPAIANDNVNIGTGDFSGKELNVHGVKFNTTTAPVVTPEGTIWWNGDEYTINIETGLGATIQVGQETLMLFYNNTGALLSNGKFVHPTAGTTVSGVSMPSVKLADASIHSGCNGTIVCATHDVATGGVGLATFFGKVRNYDSTALGLTPGVLWLSTDGSGDPTSTKPTFPNYQIALGALIKVGVTGEMFVSITSNVSDTFDEGWDGAIRESFDFRTSSNGTVVTGILTNPHVTNTDLTLLLSTGFYTFDCVANGSITLTAGTDESPVSNYVYIPIATKVLTVSTSGFPTTEHCKIAQLEIQSAATVLTELGVERNQNINDHIKIDDDNGHILHIATRIRQLNAEHDTGTEGSLTGTPTNGYIQVTSGAVWQMHNQTFSSFSMPTRNIIITNDFTTANRRTNNLNTITAYSDGNTWNNEWSKVVIWGIANKTGETNFVNLNLPSNGYNSEANAIGDSLNYADYTIPKKYKGVGFLIAAFTVRISGGTITYNGGEAYQDLRGFVPNNIAGGGGGSGITSYLGLTDTPSTNVGQAGKFPKVNTVETAHEYSQMLEDANGNIQVSGQLVESSGTGNSINLLSTVNQSGTAGYNALNVVVTETTTGSGSKNFIDLSVGGASKFSIGSGGDINLLHTNAEKVGVINKDGNPWIHDFSHPTGSTAVPVGYNTFIGEDAGNFTLGSTATSVIHGSYCTAFGVSSLRAVTVGYGNTMQGYRSGYSITSGYYNAGFGYNTLYNSVSNYGNTSFGTNSLYSLTGGNVNTALGNNAGYYALGSNNIFVGASSGYYETGSNKLYMSSLTPPQQVDLATGKTKALIYGEHNATTASQLLRVNGEFQVLSGNVGIGTSSPAASAKLEISSTTGALLVSRMTTTEQNALTPVNGMIIYNTTDAKFKGYEAGAWTNLI